MRDSSYKVPCFRTVNKFEQDFMKMVACDQFRQERYSFNSLYDKKCKPALPTSI